MKSTGNEFTDYRVHLASMLITAIHVHAQKFNARNY